MSEKINIVAIKYAESTLPESMVVRGGDKEKTVPISFIVYLIETEDRKILVDAGCETMPGFDMSYFCNPCEVLLRYGVSHEEITDLIITHAHHDHIEAVKYFPCAKIYIQREEYEKKGRKYIPEDFEVCLFETEITLCEGVKAMKIGGHSVGSSIVEIELNGKKYVVSGDEIYSRVCLDEKIPTGSSVCIEKSIDFVEKYSSEEYTVLLCHDDAVLKGENGYLFVVKSL